MRTYEKTPAELSSPAAHAPKGPTPPATLQRIAVEAVIVAAAAVMLAALLSPAKLGLGTLAPHPVWLAAVAMAARYGGRGLAVGAPVAWGELTLAALAVRIWPAVVLERLSTGADLFACAGVVLVSWIASMHERRHAEAADRVGTLERLCAADQAALAELRRVAVVLRARADRLDTSLAFLRDVAARLGGDDTDAAAQAVLDLAAARLGARAAVVHMVAETARAPEVTALASMGVWAPSGPPASEGVAGDRTAAGVLRTRRPVRAVDLPEVGPGDSDLAAPILDGDGELVGILAVRGVPQGGAGLTALRELCIIAGWAARAVARARRGSAGRAEVAAAALAADGDPELQDEPDTDVDEKPPRSVSQVHA
jgi:hypothetical protein